MSKYLLTTLIALLATATITLTATGEMTSDSYAIPTSVLSGGGGPMTSAGYEADATLGQPSPLMDPAVPPTSLTYALYPGFWYTVEMEAVDICECDLNHDGKCDMLDWLIFGQDWGRTNCNEPGVEPCECDLNHDGKCDMLDWLLFGQDWGRTNCPIP